MYDYGFNSYTIGATANSINNAMIWTIISAVVAIIGGITLYFLFLRSNKKFSDFLNKLRDFLNFKLLFLEELLKITYLILTIFITLSSFGLIAVNFVSFLTTLIMGNVILRVVYELSILLIKICQNTSDINSKLKK